MSQPDPAQIDPSPPAKQQGSPVLGTHGRQSLRRLIRRLLPPALQTPAQRQRFAAQFYAGGHDQTPMAMALAIAFVLALYALSVLFVRWRASAHGMPLTESDSWRAVGTHSLIVLLTFPFLRLRLTWLVGLAVPGAAALALAGFPSLPAAGSALPGLLVIVLIGCAAWYGNYWRERELLAKSLELEQALTGLRQAAAEAREAEAAIKDLTTRQLQLVRAVTHDIRQPMTALGIQMMLAREACSDIPKVAAALEPLAFALDALHGQIDEIAQNARSEVRSAIDLQPVNIHRLVMMAVQLHAPLAKRFQVELTSWVGSSAREACGLTHVGHLATILQSLIGNAIKYRRGTPGIARRVICVGLTRVRGRLGIRVYDNGIGIATASLPNIFDKGFSTDNDRGPASGSGLYHARRLLNPMNGHAISAVSRPWRYTCFRITLPATDLPATGGLEAEFFSESLAATIPERSAGALEGRRVLLVEDDPLVASTLNFLLSRAGAHTISVSNHAQAMASLDDQAPPPDLLICDFHLSDKLTGIDVIHDMRQRCARKIPAILISGELEHGQASEIDLPLIMKPFVSETLFRMIERALRKQDPDPIQA